MYGFVTWLVPFIVAIPFMSPQGTPRVDIFLFKKIMLLVSTAVGTALLVKLLSPARKDAFSAGIRIGLIWLAINLGLDFAILLPLSKMGVAAYMQSIGLGYLVIPMMAAGMGMAVQRSHTTGPQHPAGGSG